IQNGNLGGGTMGVVNLFKSDFMGASSGSAGPPWSTASPPFYDPLAGQPSHPPDRDAIGGTPADPPTDIERIVSSGGLYPITHLTAGSAFGTDCPAISINTDDDILSATTYPEFRTRLECVHNFAHGHIGGTISNAHVSFRDPFVFLLHSNVDRLLAK